MTGNQISASGCERYFTHYSVDCNNARVPSSNRVSQKSVFSRDIFDSSKNLQYSGGSGYFKTDFKIVSV